MRDFGDSAASNREPQPGAACGAESAAISEQWIIGENRADSREQRIRSMPHAMGLRADSSDVIQVWRLPNSCRSFYRTVGGSWPSSVSAILA